MAKKKEKLPSIPKPLRRRAAADAAAGSAASLSAPDLTYIAEDLRTQAVPIGELLFDPANARRHEEKSIRTIAASLRVYGQCKPVVVRRDNGVVIAGNGTLQAALSLGWTHLAVVKVDMDAATAAGYSISDNRTAELSEWDRDALHKLLQTEISTGHDGQIEAMFGELAEQMKAASSSADPSAAGEEAQRELAEESDSAEIEEAAAEDSLDLLFKSPYPWFGGKGRVAKTVWQRFGDVKAYIEPFFGSGAVFLNRPRPFEGIETINDFDGLVCNFWRAVQAAPEEVAKYCDWPALENDLHARHAWLVEKKDALTAALEGNVDYYDAKIAGWWCWGMALWIGSGFCTGNGPWHIVEGEDGSRELVRLGGEDQGINRNLVHLGNVGQGIKRKRVHLGNVGQGIKRKRVHLGDEGRGVNRNLVHLGNEGRGIHRQLVRLRDEGEGIHRKLVHLGNEGQGVKRKRIELGNEGKGVKRNRIQLTNEGQGVKRNRIQLGDEGRGVERRRVHLGAYGQGVNRKGVPVSAEEQGGHGERAGLGECGLLAWMQALSERLRRVRVCCGDWKRVCGGNSGDAIAHFFGGGQPCAIFLDPPYAAEADRDKQLYRCEDLQVAHAARDWAIAHGDDPRLRICLCGYEGEHQMPPSWECVSWKTKGGMGTTSKDPAAKSKRNKFRERLWFSPHCLR